MDSLFDTLENQETPVDSQNSQASESGYRGELVTLPTGTCVGRYVILDVLGRGGMGVVYKAYDPELNRQIALKMLSLQSQQGSAKHNTNLLREAQALAKLSHPNVVSVYDVGAYEDCIYIAMELVEGEMFRIWLKNHKPSRQEIVSILIAAGRGLAAAHEAGLVHRDFKPENVLMGIDGRPRVLDFGLVCATHPNTTTMEDHLPLNESISQAGNESVSQAGVTPNGLVSTMSATPTRLGSNSLISTGSALTGQSLDGAAKGTPAYMSPEQYLSAKVDARTDQFSFCVTLYEALYGCRPFAGNTVKKIYQDIIKKNIVEPSKDFDVPIWMREVMIRGLSSRTSDRYDNMSELLDVLMNDPVKAWRRRMTALGVILLCGFAIFATIYSWGQRSQQCSDVERALAGIWNRDVVTNMERAFSRSNHPGSSLKWNHVANQLEGYATQWTAASNNACVSYRIRGEQSEEMFQLRNLCLDHRRRQFAALLSIFNKANADIVERASDAVDALDRISDCSDMELLSSRPKPKAAPDSVGSVEPIRTDLARAKMLGMTGKVAHAVVLATACVKKAEKSGDLPSEIEAWYRLGVLQEMAGDLGKSEQSLRTSRWKADSIGYNSIRARITNKLISVVAKQGARYEEAKKIGDQASAIIERLGNNKNLRVDWHHNMYLASVAAGDTHQAHMHKRAASGKR